MKQMILAAGFAVASLVGGAANALTLQLDGFSSGSLGSVTINDAPVNDHLTNVGASGFNMTDTAPGGLGSFEAWCLDVSHLLMGVGDSQVYNQTNNPFSSSFGLTTVARDRVQAVFDANYATLDSGNVNQAAAFQMALWEAAFEDDNGSLGLGFGDFIASANNTIVGFAESFLSNATSYTGSKLFNLSFFEVEGDENRARDTGQNIVTASVVPLPAAGLLLLTGLLGAGALSRRRSKT